MSLLGIFMVGLFVTVIVGVACGLLVAGLIADRHDRQDSYGEELG